MFFCRCDSAIVSTSNSGRGPSLICSFLGPIAGPRARPAAVRAAMANEDIKSIQKQLMELQTEHRELDDLVRRLSLDPMVDQLHLTRLKKRKLYLKDMIQRLKSRLIPDLDAGSPAGRSAHHRDRSPAKFHRHPAVAGAHQRPAAPVSGSAVQGGANHQAEKKGECLRPRQPR